MGQTAYSGYELVLEDGFVDAANATTAYNTVQLSVEEPSGATEMTAFVRFTIPEPSAFSTAIPDNSILRGLELRLYRESPASGALTVRAYNGTAGWVEGAATWNTLDGVSTWYPDEIPGAGELRTYSRVLDSVSTSAADTAYTLDLSKGVSLEGYDFGSSINIMLFGASTTTLSFHSLSESHGGDFQPKFRVLYEIPTPVGPTITVTPQDNGTDGYINITKHSENHTGYQAVYQDNSTTVSFSGDTEDTIAITNIGQDLFDTTTFAPDALDIEDENVAFVVYAEDSINTGNNGGKGNVVVVARPKASSAAAWTGYTDSSDPHGSGGVALSGANNADIGEELALTVTGATGGASAGTLGFFKHVYVNWDSGASDTNEDYTKYTLDAAAIATAGNVAITHRYSTEGAKVIKVQIEDVNGWRSNKSAITVSPLAGTQPDIDGADPIASLTVSRTKALAAKYGDRSSAIVLSGQQSRPVGSNRKITDYLFGYEPDATSTLMTSNALNNDNSVFDIKSHKVAFRYTDDADLSVTEFTVFGLASFDGDGDPVVDDAVNFSHYKYASNAITMASSQLTQSSATANFYKTIECIVGTAIEDTAGADECARYVLQVADDTDATTPTINPDIRIQRITDTHTTGFRRWRWGGFARWRSTGTTDNKADFIAYADSGEKLAEAMTEAETTSIDVDDASTFSVGSVIQIDDEVMYVSATSGGAGGNINVIRGFCGTLAVEHDNNADIYFAGQIIIEGTNTDADSTNDVSDWYSCGFFDGDIIKVGETTNNGTNAVPKFYKMKGAGKAAGASGLYTRLAIEPLAVNLTAKEIGYLTTNFTTESNTAADMVKPNPSPTMTATMFNTSGTGIHDTVTFYHGVFDDNVSGGAGNVFETATGYTTTRVRFAQPLTLDLDTLVTDGSIAIETATMSRSGGIGATMNLGEVRYPVNAIRTRMGLPRVVVKIHVLTQAGLRDIFSLVEGDGFDFVFLDSRKVDTPTAAYRQYRMKLESGSLVQDGGTANRYLANCSFIVVGEDVT